MKKICVTKENALLANNKLNSNSTYLKRKSMEPMYKELFEVLLKIPDKEVQQRVLDAINGQTSTMCCKCKVKTEFKYNNAETQTESTETVDIVTNTAKSSIKIKCLKNYNEKTIEDSHATDKVKVHKRRRRKNCVPRVVKQSHAQQQQHLQIAKPQKRKSIQNKVSLTSEDTTPAAKRERHDSESSILENNIYYEIFQYDEEVPLIDHILNTMYKEFLIAENYENGLLPIHDAILRNDDLQLQRQIYVWNKKDTDLNELITELEEDCLQLAVLNDCPPQIYQILLKKKLNPNSVDNLSNNVIHLAILNGILLESLEILMENIDLNILLNRNDDGYTSLHIAMRNDRYQHAELILNIIDKRLGNKISYFRKQDEECKKDDFLKYYENVCYNLESSMPRPQLKRKFLNNIDMRSGNTALFYCVENKLDHMAFLLLAHFADPRVLNHSMLSAKSYFNEFGKLFDISLKIDKAMDKVIELITNII